MERLIGLDFGKHTVGVAVSDELGMLAHELETITRERPGMIKPTVARIGEIAKSTGATKLILGYPKNMDGSEGFRCEETLEFKAVLERRLGLPVILWDERLTTVESAELLDEMGVKRSEQKKVIDQIAAAIILQDYMESVWKR